jgi:signal transduction histidine kinase
MPLARPLPPAATNGLSAIDLTVIPQHKQLMKLTDNTRAICSALDQFCLPAALIDRSADRFAGWNKSFSEMVNLSSEELSLAKVSDVVRAEAPRPEKTECESAPTPVHPGQCVLRKLSGGEPISAKMFEREDGPALLLVDSNFSVDTNEDFLRGLLVGQADEKDRIRQRFHDDLAPRMMAVAFAAQSLADKAADGQPQTPQDLRDVADLISNVVMGVRSSLESRNPERGEGQ